MTVLGQRVWPFVTIVEEGCWNWTKGLDKQGYPILTLYYKQKRVNRLIVEELWGALGELVAAHTCNNKRCCRPDHLEPMTALENSQQAVRDGLFPSVISAADTLEFRNASRSDLRELARKHGISFSYAEKIHYRGRKVNRA